MSVLLPPVIPEPFAKNADPAFIQNPIPQTTGVIGRASYDLGFPPICMQPVPAGGKPPFGQDMNGLFFALTSQQYFAQAGQLWPYDADVAAAISGYSVGAILAGADGKTIWYNNVAANMTDPDGGSAAGWVSVFHYGVTLKSALTGGTTTLTAQESAAPIIVLSGVLTSNLALVVPLNIQTWLLVNNTTGSFTTTVRGATGAGVTVPQGGFSNPLGIYTNGTNVYPTVTPLGVPIDINPTPLTLAERDNAGNVIALRFAQTAGIENSLPVNAVFCQYNNNDGFLRKIDIGTFSTQLNIANLVGTVLNAQIPASAVTQYDAIILASAPLTGVPTAPTAAVGNATTQIATTAFVNPASNLVAQGSRTNADGSIDKWGTFHVGDIVAPVGGTIAFPVPFPTACYNVEITGFDANLTGATFITSGGIVSASSFSWFAREIASSTQDVTLYWRAVGK